MTERNTRRRDEVLERMGARLDDDEAENDENAESAEHSKDVENSENAEPDENAEHSKDVENSESAKRSKRSEKQQYDRGVQNVKEEWNGVYLYLPDDISDDVTDEFKRLDYQCSRELDWSPKKNRHYYPVFAIDGIETIKEMDAHTFKSRVDDLGLR